MMSGKMRRIFAVSLSLLLSLALVTGCVKKSQDNCQLERIIDLLPYWADALEDTYSEMWANRENTSWSDSAIGDALFDIADEMRVYANECHVNN